LATVIVLITCEFLDRRQRISNGRSTTKLSALASQNAIPSKFRTDESSDKHQDESRRFDPLVPPFLVEFGAPFLLIMPCSLNGPC
jgi:hypothetical protein